MKVFISHAAKDRALANELATQLASAGVDVRNPYEDIVPGENWALKVGQALEESDMMVILMTPDARESESLQYEINYALSSLKYKGRLLSVLVGPAVDVPWILLKQPTKQILSAESDLGEVVDEVLSLAH